MSDIKLFEEVLENNFDHWEEDMIKQIEENFDEHGTGSVTVKSFSDPSWEKNLNYREGWHVLDKDYLLKNGQKPTKAEMRVYRKNSIGEDFIWISNYIQHYFQKKAAKETDLIKCLRQLYKTGWYIEAWENEVVFQKRGEMPIKLTDIESEIRKAD